MEKQTAVELLIEDLTRLGHNFKLYKKEIEQAKEMEKQQMIDAYMDSTCQFANDARIDYPKSAEQYYNETFNKD
jgi:hypothetical protein